MDEKNIVEEQNIIPEEKPVTPSVDTALLARWVRDLCGHDPDCPDRAYWYAGHACVYDRYVNREYFEGCVYL